MNKLVSDFLNCLIQSVGYLDQQTQQQSLSEIKNDAEYLDKMHSIQQKYEALSKDDRNEFYSVLDQEFKEEVALQLYLLSLMIEAIKSRDIYEKAVELIERDHLDVYFNVSLEYQILAKINKSFGNGELYDLQRKLHAYNLQCWKKEITAPADYIPFEKRNKSRIVIITEQILAEQHAPTKITLNLCRTLQQELGMEVYLISCPINSGILSTYNAWMDVLSDQYYEEMNGNYVVKYSDGKMFLMEQDLKGQFLLIYKECMINGCQIVFERENSEKFKSLLQSIYEFNPAFIYNVDAVAPIAELCSGFTTVVSGAMNYGYPVSEAQILMKLATKDELDLSNSDIHVLESYQQLIIQDELQFDVEKAVNPENRAMYGIKGDAFLIVIIGNRLSTDLTEQFKRTLIDIFSLDSSIELLLIGEYPEYINYFSDEIFTGRIHYINYHYRLSELIGIADLYLNPPRNGGGTSALISLNFGVPVVTLPGGDVAGNIGKDFTCQDESDLVETVSRYMSDKDFYERQKRRGQEYTNRLVDFASKERNKLAKITKAISILEEGAPYEN